MGKKFLGENERLLFLLSRQVAVYDNSVPSLLVCMLYPIRYQLFFSTLFKKRKVMNSKRYHTLILGRETTMGI